MILVWTFIQMIISEIRGDPINPKVCVKYAQSQDHVLMMKIVKMIYYSSGYCINEICSVSGIYDNCNLIKTNVINKY